MEEDKNVLKDVSNSASFEDLLSVVEDLKQGMKAFNDKAAKELVSTLDTKITHDAARVRVSRTLNRHIQDWPALMAMYEVVKPVAEKRLQMTASLKDVSLRFQKVN